MIVENSGVHLEKGVEETSNIFKELKTEDKEDLNFSDEFSSSGKKNYARKRSFNSQDSEARIFKSTIDGVTVKDDELETLISEASFFTQIGVKKESEEFTKLKGLIKTIVQELKLYQSLSKFALLSERASEGKEPVVFPPEA